MKTPPETQFALLLDDLNIKYEREYPFHQWRFDFAVPWYKVAFEVNGGIFKKITLANGYKMQGGRHQTGKGYSMDCKKIFTAQTEGWVVFPIPSPWLYHTSRHKQQKYLMTYEEVKERIKAFFS